MDFPISPTDMAIAHQLNIQIRNLSTYNAWLKEITHLMQPSSLNRHSSVTIKIMEDHSFFFLIFFFLKSKCAIFKRRRPGELGGQSVASHHFTILHYTIVIRAPTLDIVFHLFFFQLYVLSHDPHFPNKKD